jgi:hypothetical protein
VALDLFQDASAPLEIKEKFKMNLPLLAEKSEKLEKILFLHAPLDEDISKFFDALSKLIHDARTGKIIAPVDWRDVSGAHYFTEKALRKYSAIETAYAEFKIEVTGGESPALKQLCLNAAKKL